MQKSKNLPVYRPGSGALLSQCSPLSPPSSAGRCRSAGQWLARHSCLCMPRARQSPESCCPRSLPPGRTSHRISAWACWRGCQSPCSGRRLALPRRLTWLWECSVCRSFFSFSYSSCQLRAPGQPPPSPGFKSRWSHCDKGKTICTANAAWKHSHGRERTAPRAGILWLILVER